MSENQPELDDEFDEDTEEVTDQIEEFDDEDDDETEDVEPLADSEMTDGPPEQGDAQDSPDLGGVPEVDEDA